MDKQLLAFVDDYKLDCVNGKLVYGSVNGYQIAVKINPAEVNSFNAFIFTKLNDELNVKLNNFFVENKKALKLVECEINSYGIRFRVATVTKKSGYNNLRKALEALTSYFKENGALDEHYCPLCGKFMETKKLVLVHGLRFNLDEDCAASLQSELNRMDEEFISSPNNYLKGFVGALTGGFVGALVWVFVGCVLGLISGWIAFLITWLCGVGYSKARGKANNMKIVISGVVTFIYIIISMIIVYVVMAAKVGLDFFEIVFTEEAIMGAFVGDLLMALLFGALGLFFSIRQMKKTLYQTQEKM